MYFVAGAVYTLKTVTVFCSCNITFIKYIFFNNNKRVDGLLLIIGLLISLACMRCIKYSVSVCLLEVFSLFIGHDDVTH